MKYQRGLSLVELMVAILLSLVLTLGVLQLFSNTSSSDRTNTAIARVQESGRIALEIIGADARRAGYQGCVSSANTVTVGGIKFPSQVVKASSKTVTFIYATQENTGTAFGAATSCDGSTLYLKSVTYKQCTNNASSICMNDDPILDNSTITAIDFGLHSATSTTWKESASVSATELATAQSVRITLEIKEPRNEVTRTFTNTYELRNRLL